MSPLIVPAPMRIATVAADQDPVAQYRQVQHRDSNPPFHSYEREG